jgi:uncharacterized damage-inducible protein DinB
MISPAYCVKMARYNAWMNGKIFAASATLTDAQRKQDRGAFFGSIHGTLSHLFLGDLAWMRRFAPEASLPCHGVALTSLDQVLFDAFVELREARQALDAQTLSVMQTISQNTIDANLRYHRVNGELKEMPMALALTHFFNHQTHHRGQVTTLLSQSNVDVGDTDLVWLPAE